MAQNVFYPGLNDFCRKYLVADTALSELDKKLLPARLRDQLASIFEQLLLFDRITFKVYGENLLIPILLKHLGTKGFYALVEEEAIGFALWTPTIVYMKDNIPGVETLGSGNLNSAPHADPEKSIETGLSWLVDPLTVKQKKNIIKKVLPLYVIPDATLAAKSVNVVKASFNSGRLSHYGLNPETKKLDNLSTDDKKILARCGDDILEYNFLVGNGLTSFSEYKYFSPFWDTIERFRVAHKMQEDFARIATIEGFPQLKSLFEQLDNPLQKLPYLRQNRHSVKFRSWLENTSAQSVSQDVVKSYIDSVTEKKGFFDSSGAKFVKSIAMATLGYGLGETIHENAGLLAASVAAISGDTVIDLLDSFLLERVSKGWSPRMFFDELNKIPKKENMAKAS